MSANANIFYKLRAIDSILESFAKQFSGREVKFFAQYGVSLVSNEITMISSLRLQFHNGVEGFTKAVKVQFLWDFQLIQAKLVNCL